MLRNFKHGVYAGSFDPFTVGHEHILKQAIASFDGVTLAIGINPDKKPYFTVEQREEFLNDMVQKYKGNLQVTTFTNEYLVNYAAQIGATHIIRGLRNAADFSFEYSMNQINRSINPDIQSVYFMANSEFAEVSSSMVKSMIGPNGWQAQVAKYIPKETWARFQSLVK